ncbi:MAG: hypothetical protein ACXVDD_01180 [Polyangia bacterium]
MNQWMATCDEDEVDPQRLVPAQLSARLTLQQDSVAAPLQQKGGIPKWNAAFPQPYVVTAPGLSPN